jgi:hypothetical protein
MASTDSILRELQIRAPSKQQAAAFLATYEAAKVALEAAEARHAGGELLAPVSNYGRPTACPMQPSWEGEGEGLACCMLCVAPAGTAMELPVRPTLGFPPTPNNFRARCRAGARVRGWNTRSAAASGPHAVSDQAGRRGGRAAPYATVRARQPCGQLQVRCALGAGHQGSAHWA